MHARDDTFVDFVVDQLHGLGPVVVRRMFGGHGLYHGGTFFAIVWNGQLFLKTDDESRRRFIDAGTGPFQPGEGQTLVSYYEVPPDVLEDDDELAAWAQRAVQAAANQPARGRRASGARPTVARAPGARRP